MQTEIMLALCGNLKKDYSEKNQLKQIDMLRMMLEINQDAVVHGISKLEDYENDAAVFPMLCRGLKLVRDGIISIQMLCSPDVTRELLLSYFSFDQQDNLRKGLQDLKINFSEPLNMAEIEKLMDGQGL